MPKKPVLKSIVCDFLRQNPGISHRSAAAKLAALYPESFNEETARGMVRKVRGSYPNRRTMTPVDDLAEEWAAIRAELPAPIKYNFTPVKPVTGAGKYLVMSDIHVPFHSSIAVEAAVRRGVEDGVDAVILNGDVWDCMEFSKFCPTPGRRDVTAEAFAARSFFAYLRKQFPNAEIVYKIGNHEERLAKFFARHLLGTLTLLEQTGRTDRSIASVAGLLDLQDFDIRMIEDKRPVLLGKHLYVLHGHEAGGSSYAPVSPARTIALKAGVCAIISHHHRTSQHPGKRLDGRHIVTYSTGHLADPEPEYAPMNEWNWGFARVDIDSAGGFRVYNYRISDHGEVWI